MPQRPPRDTPVEAEIELAPVADARLTMAFKEKDDSATSQKAHIAVESATQQNFIKCHANEDQFLKGSVGSDAYCFGVVDGHDGVYAADLVANTFVKFLEEALHAGSHVIAAIENSIACIEKLLEEATTTAGACCLVCVHSKRYMWCANLGDCRGCFISIPTDIAGFSPGEDGESMLWLSRDMKAAMSYEKERIEKAGGRVLDQRVEGLDPSRTVGDFDVKHRVPPTVISIIPETRYLDLEKTGPGVAVLCTDGVWDVLVASDIDRIVSLRLPLLEANTSQPQEFLRSVSADIVAYSIAKGSPDDCTAVCSLVGCPQE